MSENQTTNELVEMLETINLNEKDEKDDLCDDCDLEDMFNMLENTFINKMELYDKINFNIRNRNVKWFQENMECLYKNLTYEELHIYHDKITEIDDSSYTISVILNIFEELLYEKC